MTSERGFTLLEVVCCVAIVAIAAAATLGAVAGITRNAENGATRDVAMMVAENAMARARAATAYVPQAQPSPEAASQTATWALGASASYSAGGLVLGPMLCGTGSANVQLPVSTAYDSTHNTFTVTVTYPRNPCVPTGPTSTVTLAQTLPYASYVPGKTTLVRTIPPPANM